MVVSLNVDMEDAEESSGEFSEDLRVFVGNLPFSDDSAQLAGLFEQAGSIKMVEVYTLLAPFLHPISLVIILWVLIHVCHISVLHRKFMICEIRNGLAVWFRQSYSLG